jgi:predicted 3-demethylubiquinone-9 3-methyltransferase (glyoxalase superfamily)
VRWQIVPSRLDEMLQAGDETRAKKVTEVMLKMVKLDIAALEKAYRS